MVIAITNGIKVSAVAQYLPYHSDPKNRHYVFSYKIYIENNSEYTIQLISRHWDIFDSIGLTHEVSGLGVVGNQPILEPGESYEYVSGCNFASTIGKMEGVYLIEILKTGKGFNVYVPTILMEVPYILN